MSPKHVFCFTIVIPLLLILYLNTCTKRALAECLTNFYKDGNMCIECPAGYYNDNCSDVCPAPLYGLLCAQKCDCVPCHHVYGCSLTLFIEEATNDDFETRSKKEENKQASGNRTISDIPLECSTNYYKDGNECKECPVGYYNDNCSDICPLSYYGPRCAQKCDCLPCHHVYGCSSSPFIEETASDYISTRDKIEDKTKASGNKLTTSEAASDYITKWDKIEDKKQASGNKLTTSGRIIIISIGSVLCFILMLVIIRELWLGCQFPQPTGKRTIINDVYEDIAEIDSVRVE
ncbi:protein draper-like [Crassostrea angulata]|uniref:protein draper-like n=1 Tax=Magallana angulata TaxID=2784310 RepID=UPI0022B0927A|nr:protein draper-like [Crassostrea angulata]